MSRLSWPTLPLEEWEPTYKTLHRWTQMAGKVALAFCPSINHWWHISLRFQPTGLTTTLIPYQNRQFAIAFDFIEHKLRITITDGAQREIALEPRSVADFYQLFLQELHALGLDVKIWPMPVEIPNPVAFTEDHANASYDRKQVAKMWSILSNVNYVFTQFRGRFTGKSSPVHFFWGGFDVALTRFSGRRNSTPPADRIMAEGYSHEVISHGLWFGGDWPTGGRVTEPIFYAYAVPEPKGFAESSVKPSAASYAKNFGEFMLPYHEVIKANDPVEHILWFMQSTYDAGAKFAQWDLALENT